MNPDRQSIIGNIATDGSGSGRGYFQEWVTQQDAVWVDRAGCVHLIDRMPFDYVLNVLSHLYENHAKRIAPAAENPLIQKLRARLLVLAPSAEPDDREAVTPAERTLYRADDGPAAIERALVEIVLHNRPLEPAAQDAVTFCYHDLDRNVTTRNVVPKYIESRGFGMSEKFWLVAYDRDKDAPRSFRLDGIQWVEVPA